MFVCMFIHLRLYLGFATLLYCCTVVRIRQCQYKQKHAERMLGMCVRLLHVCTSKTYVCPFIYVSILTECWVCACASCMYVLRKQMFVRIYIYTHIYIHADIHKKRSHVCKFCIHIYILIHTYIYIYMYIYMYLCMGVDMYTYIYIYVCICI